ncbi:retrovirus-related pol polyprotein from transposon TNT 1-94 [Tanacetum coccineum]
MRNLLKWATELMDKRLACIDERQLRISVNLITTNQAQQQSSQREQNVQADHNGHGTTGVIARIKNQTMETKLKTTSERQKDLSKKPEMTNLAKVKECFSAEIQIFLLENVLSTESKYQRAFIGISRAIAVDESDEKICLESIEPDEWIKDSGCSKHMTGNRKLFSTYKAYNGGNVIFCSNLRGNIIGKGCSIVSIRTNHGREFDNEVQFGEFCNANGITHNFSAPHTPQLNGVVKRKNRTPQEMSRTMLNEQSLPQKFWCNVIDTLSYILNRILIRDILGKTPYELLRGRKPTLDYFRVFGSKCFILNTKDYLTKFDPKSYEGVILGYSQNSKAYIILNKHTRKVEESLNVTFDETPPPSKTSPLVEDDLDKDETIKVTEKKNLENDIVDC